MQSFRGNVYVSLIPTEVCQSKIKQHTISLSDSEYMASTGMVLIKLSISMLGYKMAT